MDNTTRVLNALKATIENNPKEKKLFYSLVIFLVVLLFLLFYVVLDFSIFSSIIISALLWVSVNIGLLIILFVWGGKNPEKLEPIADRMEKEIEISDNVYLINEQSKDILNNNSIPLPISLKQLHVKDFQSIEKSLQINSIPINSQWIILTGENGSGKTSILRAIAIGFLGRKDGDDVLIDNLNTKIGIEFYNRGQSIIKHLWNKSLNDNTPIFQLACYGPFRLELQTDSSENEVKGRSGIAYGLFNNNNILLSIEYELKKMFWKKETEKFDTYKSILCKVGGFAEIEIEEDRVWYYEKDNTEKAYEGAVAFEALASGSRSIIAMVGDMMIRLFKSQPEITEPSELAGIVIIDELDLHWHPKIQREIPSLLSSIFPKVQFIASTHSLVPLLGAPENSVLLKVNRTVTEGITVEKVGIDFQALSSDTMLRDIFDLEEYMSDPKIRAWERYTKLKGLIHFEKDEAKKNEYIHEREILGDKYNFTL